MPNTVEIYGDRIMVDGAAVACFLPAAPGWLRDRFEAFLRVGRDLGRQDLMTEAEAEHSESQALDLETALNDALDSVEELEDIASEIEVGNLSNAARLLQEVIEKLQGLRDEDKPTKNDGGAIPDARPAAS